MLVIQLANASDIEELCSIDSALRTDPARAGHIAQWVDHAQCHLIRCDGNIAGYLALTYDFYHSGFVEMLMVAQQYRRRRFGAALLDHAVQLCATETLWTSTNTSNLAMRQLLAHTGFVESGFIEGLDEGDPELVFRRPIGQKIFDHKADVGHD